MNKNILVFRIVFLSVIAISLISVLVSLLFFDGFKKWNIEFFRVNSKAKITYDEVYDYNGLSQIDIHSVSSEIKVLNTTDNQIRVVSYGVEEDKINFSLNKETLKVEIDRNVSVCFFCFHTKNKIEVYIPKAYQNKINVKTISGDIGIESFPANHMIIKTVSGEVGIESAKNLKVNTTSGDMNVQYSKKAELSSVSGEISLGEASKYVKIKTTSGNIEINHLNLTKDSLIRTVSGEVIIDSINGVYIDTSSLSGEQNVYSNNRKSEIILSIKTTSGDIEVNKKRKL